MIAALILLSFAIPVILPLFQSDDPPENDRQSLQDFILPTTGGGDIRLSEYAGSRSYTVLVFHRGPDCGSCRDQLLEYQTGYSALQAEDAGLLVISLMGEEPTTTMANQLGLPYPMLYNGSPVASTYGIRTALEGDYLTATIIVDAELRPVINPVGTLEGEVLPSSIIVQALQSADESRASLRSS